MKKIRMQPKTVIKVATMIAAFAAIFVLQSDLPKESKSIIPRMAIPSDALRHMVLGYNLMAADFIWLDLIQDMDYRESKTVNKGWVYNMLDNITVLDPRFRMAYAAGTTILSVVVQDVEGARLLFEKAMVQFPNDWSLAYRAGYHYLYEVKNCVRAAELLKIAANNGAPAWLNSLVTKLYLKAGQIQIAQTVLYDALKRFQGNEEVEKRLKERLSELQEAERDPVKAKALFSNIDCKAP